MFLLIMDDENMWKKLTRQRTAGVHKKFVLQHADTNAIARHRLGSLRHVTAP